MSTSIVSWKRDAAAAYLAAKRARPRSLRQKAVTHSDLPETQKAHQQRGFMQMTKEQIVAMGYKLKHITSAEESRARLSGRDGFEFGCTFHAREGIIVTPAEKQQ